MSISGDSVTTTYYSLAGGTFTQNWDTAPDGVNFTNVPSIKLYGGEFTSAGSADPSAYLLDFTTLPVYGGANSSGNPSAGGAYYYSGAGLNPTFGFQGSGSQDYIALVFHLDATGRQNIVFNANLRDLDPSGDTGAQAVQIQYRLGETGNWTNVAGGTFTNITAAGSATTVTAVSVTLPAAADDKALVQIRVMTGNAPSNDQMVGVDDIAISSTALPSGNPGSLAIAAASAIEGDSGTSNLGFVVTRSGGSTGAVSASYAISLNGTANSSDLDATQTGTVNFADGETSKTITIGVHGDTIYEANETFSVVLSGATGGVALGTASAIGTILNDDANPAGSLAIGAASVTEGDGGTTPMTFTVTRSGGSTGAITADYAVSFNGTANAADLSGATTGTVSFADGETSKAITINVAGDTTFEGNETFSVVLSNPQGGAAIGTASATGTISNDDAAPPPAPLFINEIHYDNAGTDAGEAIEIAGPAGTDLTGWKIELYNGSNNALYDTKTLSGTIGDQSNGYGTVKVQYAVNGIQNGNPDSVALVSPDGTVVQFLSYGGTMTVIRNGVEYTSTDIGVVESGEAGALSLQLVGTGAVYSDFTWQTPAANSFGAFGGAAGAVTSGVINAGQTFYPITGDSHIRIGDVNLTEGDSGTKLMTFTVTRSGGSSSTASVDYFLNLTGSADANDLAPGTPLSGTVYFGVGDVSRTISVSIVGDTTPEPNETFNIKLANPTNGSVGHTTYIEDNTGIGTIVNDDPISLHTYEVQGAGLVSEYVGQKVTTTAIVTAVGNSGFYIQDAAGDGNANTSDAIFVSTTSKASVAVGDSVTVTGTIQEAGSNGQLTVTQFAQGATVTVGTHDNVLPAAVLIGHDGLHPPTSIIDNDHLTSFDPTTDGIDFFETLEGMRVTVEAPQVIARTDSSETWVVASHGQDATGLNAAGGLTVSAGDFNPEKILIDPTSDVSGAFTGTFSQGDQLADVTGILTYGTSSSNDVGYKVIPTTAATLTHDATLQPEVTALLGDATHLTIASFNMENADVGDGAAKFQMIASTVVYNLHAPDIIFAQEIQDADGAGAGTDYTGTVTANAVIAAIDAAGGPHYTYVEVAPTANNTTGGESNGNIRPGYFYNADRVSYVEGSATQINDAAYDGSRKPLVAQFVFNEQTITTVDLHSTSRLGSDALFGSYQPPIDGGDSSRTAQAQAAADYVHSLLQADPNANVVVGGDFNGFYFESAFAALTTAGLTNLNSLIPVEERYSYLFNGNLEQIDNLLASSALMDGAQFDAVHINTLKAADAPMATDHDQVITSLYIPLANHAPVAVGDGVGVNEDATSSNLYAALLSNDNDPDAGTTLTITGVNTSGTLGHVLFDAASHTLQYVADNDAFDTLKTGTGTSDSFTYTISDGTLTSTATVNVTVTGIADTVTTNGGAGNDTFSGSGADDRIYGNAGNDTLAGGGGADFISGGLGTDTINGDAGHDILLGGAGNDTITGGSGDDYLSGDAGNDILTGGTGADIFAFGQLGGRDTINDFDTTLDKILLANNINVTNTLVSDVDHNGTMDLTLSFTSGTQAVLLGVQDFAAVHIDRTTGPLITDPMF
jgi:predicted extracellular nuclease